MYNALFFGYEPKPFRDAIEEFTAGVDFFYISQRAFQQSRIIKRSLDDSDVWYEWTFTLDNIPWFVCAGGSKFELVQSIPMRQGTSINDSDEIFRNLSRSFSWSIIPWGGMYGLSMFVFISSKDSFADSFLTTFNQVILSNSEYCEWFPVRSEKRNMLVYLQVIKEKFCDHVKGLIFTSNNPGKRIWEMFSSMKLGTPIIALLAHVDSNLRNYVEQVGTHIKSSREQQVEELDWFFGEDKINKLSYSQFVYFEDSKFEHYGISLIRLEHGKDFQEFIRILIAEEEQLIAVIPSVTSVGNIYEIMIKIANKYQEVDSDLGCVSEILEKVKCFCGVNRDSSNIGASLFISNDSQIVNKFDSLKIKDDYNLISSVR